MSERIEKVNSILLRALSDIILIEHNHPRFKMISVLKVDTSKDLANAKISVSALENAEDLVKYLTKLKPVFRKKLARKIKLRTLPNLAFYLDEDGDYLGHIHSLFEKTK